MSQLSSPFSKLLPADADVSVARILESITDGFAVFDSEWRFIYLNEAAKHMFARHLDDPSALLGQNHWEAFPESRGTLVEQEYHRAVREGVDVHFENFYPPWCRWFAMRGYPIRGGGLTVYFRDVTEEKQTLSLLRASEKKYRSLFNSLDQGFSVIEMIWDEQGAPIDYRFVEVNPAFEKQTGLREAVGRTALELIPDLDAHWITTYAHVSRTGEASRFIEHSKPLRSWFDVYAFPIGDGPDHLVAILFNDVTDRRQSEKELERLGTENRDRLAELEALLEVIPVGIGIALDRECRNIRLNPAFAQVLGLDTETNASKTAPESERPSNFRVVDDRGSEVNGLDLPMQTAAREGREIRGVELNVEHADGRRVRLLEYAAPLFDAHGEPRGSVGAFVDITDRQHTELRQRFLISLEEAVRPLTDPGSIVATIARLLGEHLGVGRCAYAEVESDEDTMNITGDYCREVPSIVGRYTFTQFGMEVLQLMRANKPYVVADVEHVNLSQEVLASYHATNIHAVICVPLHKGGKFVAAMAVHHKTSRQWTQDEIALTLHVANRCWEALERARVTRELEQSEERFRTLAENMVQLAWMADPDGGIFWYNQRWYDYTGTTFEQMQGWGWESVHHPVELQRMLPIWREALASGEAWEDTFPLRRADGQYGWFLSRAFPIRDEQGKIMRWFGTNTDVTEQRAAAEALAQANKAKDNFMAALSHELRTPLTPVLMAAEDLCEDPALPPHVHETLSMMRRNIALEARLIDDLLDLTRISRGKLALRFQDGEVHSLVGLALEIVRDDAQAKAITFDTSFEALNTHLRCDPARLQQVFWNLLKNAVKFTPAQGRIAVRSRDEGRNVIIEVSDTGIGIAPESLDRIFLPFEQAELGQDHRYGGLGLGLSISKTIVEMHGGTLVAESAGLNLGATFRVELSAKERTTSSVAQQTFPPKAPEPSGDVLKPPGLRLLVVEDHEPTLAVLARLLRRTGHTVTTANSSAAAQELAANATFDLVVSDIGLPDGSGLSLMKILHTQHGLRGVALTGYGMEDDQRRALESGFVAHLTKPVDFAQLRRVLEKFTPG